MPKYSKNFCSEHTVIPRERDSKGFYATLEKPQEIASITAYNPCNR